MTISIPIFTSQLKKARVATNQANARSAHAALVAEPLEQDDATNAGSDTYTVSSGSLSGTVSEAITGKVTSDPSTWKTDTETGTASTAMGDKAAKTWTISIDTNGAVSYTPGF